MKHLVVITVSIFLCGCSTELEAQSESAQKAINWSALSFDVSGKGGEWIVGYHEMSPHFRATQFSMWMVDVESLANTDVAGFVCEPTYTTGSARKLIEVPKIHFHNPGESHVSGATMDPVKNGTGIFFCLGALEDWRGNLTIIAAESESAAVFDTVSHTQIQAGLQILEGSDAAPVEQTYPFQFEDRGWNLIELEFPGYGDYSATVTSANQSNTWQRQYVLPGAVRHFTSERINFSGDLEITTDFLATAPPVFRLLHAPYTELPVTFPKN